MFEKLAVMENKYEEISSRLSDPETVSDNKLYAQLMREYKNMTPIIEKYREYKTAENNFTEAKELLDAGGLDKEFKEMAQLEYEEGKVAMEELSQELKILLLPKDPNDDKNVIIEIRGGAGGEEASLFAYELYRMYVKLDNASKLIDTFKAEGILKHEIFTELTNTLPPFETKFSPVIVPNYQLMHTMQLKKHKLSFFENHHLIMKFAHYFVVVFKMEKLICLFKSQKQKKF